VTPAVDPILIDSWPKGKPNWSARLPANYDSEGPNTIIIDEGQLTYWDTGFWTSFLKSIMNYPTLDRVILFASYGSPIGGVTSEGTPMDIPDDNRVSLQAVDHGDGIPAAGLLFTHEEFAEVVEKSYPSELFEQDFLDYVFRVTFGHAGAVADLLRIVTAHDVSFRIRLQHSLIIGSSHTVM
jgi:hypothetical protein